jgi:translocation and assembly module TamA
MSRSTPARLRAGPLGPALIAALACSAGQPKPDQPEVKSIRIEGARRISEGELKSKILTGENSWWPFADKYYFDPNVWQADLRRIRRAYQAEGYYGARILDQQIIPKSSKAVDLRVRVEEGSPTHITKILFKGFEALPPEHQKEALSDLPVTEGHIFKENDWELVKGEVQSKLRELGYAEAVTRGTALVDLEKQQAELRLESEVGQRYRFGDVSVTTNPNPHAPISWIREQAEGAMRKGTWVSQSAMIEAQARVFKMGVFGAVKVNPGTPDRQDGLLPVTVDVREAPFHTLRVGGGIGIDPTRNEVHLIGEYTDRDLFGGLRKLTLRGRLGWAFLPNLIAVLGHSQAVALKSEPIFLASSEFEQPRTLSKDIRLQTSLQIQKDAQQAYSFIGGRGRIGLAWQPTSSFSVIPSYNLETDYLLSGQATLGGKAPELFYGCPPFQVNCVIVLSYLEQAIIWDRRNDVQDPRRGFYLSLSVQEGGGPLGGSFDYLRITPEGRYYRSFPRDQRYTLALKVKLGSLRPLRSAGTSPIVARFFSGGDAMRGFNYRRLSPLLIVPQNPSQTLQDGVVAPVGLQGVTVPIGGNALFESSIEFRYNFPKSDFVVASFLDMGFVTPDDILSQVRERGLSYFTHNMLYAVGAGLRYRTPIGPIRLDIARRLNIGPPLLVIQQSPPLNPPPAENGFFGLNSGVFRFIGGQNRPPDAGYPEGIWSFHLSIGEPF